MRAKTESPPDQQKKNIPKVAVIGAGPAGLAAAVHLRSQGVDVDLYESQNRVGGLCQSFELWGHIVDLGPHRFFSSNERVNRFWFQTVGAEVSWVRRQTRIFYQQKYFEYPLEAWNTFSQLGLKESLLSFLSYVWAKMAFRGRDDHFENWVIRRFGRRLYQIFFKTYSEKLWGLSCTQIDPDFAYRKIRRLSVFEIAKNFLKSRKTFVDQFAYPHRGTGSVYQILANRFQKMGGTLKLNTPVQGLSDLQGQIEVVTAQGAQSYDHVISTMPLNLLIQQLDGVPTVISQAARELTFRNTILVYLWVENKNLFPDNWIYVHSPHVRFGRVTNFNNWGSPQNEKARGTVLCLEYWCDSDENLWRMSDAQICAQAVDEWKTSRIADNSGAVLGTQVVRLPKSYPVFKLGYKKPLKEVKTFLQNHLSTLTTIGRYGAFKYNNQDHSLLMGLRAADQVLRGRSADAEAVNSDHVYEEDFELKDIRFDTFDEV